MVRYRWAPRTPTRLVAAGLVVATTMVWTALAPSPSAAADPGDYLQITKAVDNPTPGPGESFTYTIQATCSEQDCLDAQLTDTLPAELAGFDLQNVTLTPAPATVPRTITWNPGGSPTPPAQVGSDTGFTIDLQQTTDDPVGIGLGSGTTFTIALSLRVPDDYPPGTSPDIVNTATATATNANPVSDNATVNIVVATVIDVGVTKSWTPSTQLFNPGATSTIGLGVRNTSNVPVTTLTMQEPAAAPDGAATLDPSNPFTITDFTGFGTTSLPTGCDTVRVDAYVFGGSTWGWVTGTPVPVPTLELPAGVTNAEVGGLRVECNGDIDPGASLAVDLALAQRATQRDTGADLSTSQHRVDNVMIGSVAASGQDPVTDQASASYVVNPAVPSVDAVKDITPNRITAGQSSTGTLTTTNGGVPVASMTVSDLAFFTDEVTFGGFTTAPAWPTGATGATIAWFPLAGGPPVGVAFSEGDTPAPPGFLISGFEITWTGTLIQADAASQVQFTIATSEAAATDAPLTLTNTVDAEVVAPNGLDATATDSDDLTLVNPDIDVTLAKTILPTSAVEPGETVISSLTTTATSQGDGAAIHEIVVEDAWGGGTSELWNAFDLVAIAPTQVPADTTMTIEVQDPAGTWHQLTVDGPQAVATVFQLTEPQLAAALSALGLTSADVQGIRFTFTNNDPGFPATTTITPHLVHEARPTLRTGGSVTPGPDQPTTYTNTAITTAEGETAGGRPLTDTDTDTGQAIIVTGDGGGPGDGVGIAKRWLQEAVSSQSGQRATTTLVWSVDRGLATVTISDPAADFADPSGTVFDAFDLVRVNPIPADTEPFSNGWWLRYDDIAAVQLFDGSAWVTVPTPAGGWVNASGAFVGYDLTAPQQATTTGVRLVLEPDDAARTAAQQTGPQFDPFAPAPGSGVGSGSTDRTFDLTWQVRDQKRSDGAFVVADELYNAGDPGIVDNTTAIDGTPIGGGDPVRATASDTIAIVDPDPGVIVDKTVSAPNPIYVPQADPGTPAGDYPTATWTVTAHNASVARASYLRVTDPATCTDVALAGCQSVATPGSAVANPFVTDGSVDYLASADNPNPLQRFDVTDITIAASIPAQVDLTSSVVWLLRYDGGSYTAEQTTAAAVNAGLTEPGTIVGISVTFTSSDPATTGGTLTQANNLSITLETRLRPTIRTTGAAQVLPPGTNLDVVNRAFAQSYDPVVAPGVVTGDVDDATVRLTGGEINVGATKAVTPDLVLEANPDAPVTVQLGADQGSNPRSSLSPSSVVIEDQAGSAEFWNTFRLTGLGALTLPAGSDRVRVDVYGPFGTGGALAWVTGTPVAVDPEIPVPAASYADVQGVRFTFSRADGDYFSAVVPAPNWSAAAAFTVQARGTYLDSGEPLDFTGTVTNTQTSQSIRRDGNNSTTRTAADTIALDQGTRELAVNKLTNGGNRLASVGDTVPFTLTLRNVGTGTLTLTELRDVLPPELVFTGTSDPTYTADPDGTLSTDVTVSSNPNGSVLTFTWPDDGRVMRPGETFVIDLPLELQPGLSAGQTATNVITAETAEELSRCTNTQPGGSTTDDWADDPSTCGTSDFVGIVNGPNLFTVKGVRGALDPTPYGGAYNPANPATVCAPTLTATPGATVASDGRFYRAPCVAHSLLTGVDDWVLHVANAGTVDVDRMIIVDQLPVSGDRQLISGNSRGSQYRPQIVPGSFQLTMPSSTQAVIEVTSSPDVCVGTWANLQNQPPCEQNGEAWATATADTDWSAVSGIRVTFDFAPTSGRALTPGQLIDVNYSTRNVPRTAGDPSGASTTVPGSDQLAWNQFGVKYHNAGADQDSKIAPNRVGVHLRFGSIQVEKAVIGPAAETAPDSFTVDVVCTVGSGDETVPLDLGDDATLELTADNGFERRIDGIPMGATCTVAESGPVGEFGETSREGSPATLVVAVPTDPGRPLEEQDVPEAQVARITNVYDWTGFDVDKAITGNLDNPASRGPFTVTATCTWLADGERVPLRVPGGPDRVLSRANGYHASYAHLPTSTRCRVVETESGGALETSVRVTGPEGSETSDGTRVVLDLAGTTTGDVTVEFTNRFGAVSGNDDGDGDGLPDTGSSLSVWPWALGALLVAGGALALVAGRRRRGGRTTPGQ
ncbi:MAG: DUF5979 domain-containing protein [Nocardioidaceae bacterium]